MALGESSLTVSDNEDELLLWDWEEWYQSGSSAAAAATYGADNVIAELIRSGLVELIRLVSS